MDGGDLCPVCGNDVGETFNLPRGPAGADSVIPLAGPQDVGDSYNICGVCGVEYGYDCDLRERHLTGDGAEPRDWRHTRRQLRALLRTGRAEVNAQDKNGNTALDEAIVHGGVRAGEVVRVLLEAGARADLRNRSGVTPLDEAIRRKAPDALVGLLRVGGGAGGASDGGAGG